MLKDLSISEGSLERLKRLSDLVVPLESPIFLEELGHPQD